MIMWTAARAGCRPFWHGRHFSAASNSQIVLCGVIISAPSWWWIMMRRCRQCYKLERNVGYSTEAINSVLTAW